MSVENKKFELLKTQAAQSRNALDSAHKTSLYVFLLLLGGLLFTEAVLKGEWSPIVLISMIGSLLSIYAHVKIRDAKDSLEYNLNSLIKCHTSGDWKHYKYAEDYIEGQCNRPISKIIFPFLNQS